MIPLLLGQPQCGRELESYGLKGYSPNTMRWVLGEEFTEDECREFLDPARDWKANLDGKEISSGLVDLHTSDVVTYWMTVAPSVCSGPCICPPDYPYCQNGHNMKSGGAVKNSHGWCFASSENSGNWSDSCPGNCVDDAAQELRKNPRKFEGKTALCAGVGRLRRFAHSEQLLSAPKKSFATRLVLMYCCRMQQTVCVSVKHFIRAFDDLLVPRLQQYFK